MKKINSIGVIGHRGMVGKTTYDWFKAQKKYKVYGYSLSERTDYKETLNADLIFVCVPTPFDWKEKTFNGKIVDDTLANIPGGKVVVIKSTVPIGTTNKLQKKYPKLKLLFNPEFLSEATCEADFTNPDRQFVGYTPESYKEAVKVLHTLPESAFDAIMPAKEAELLKYINNIHGTIEVMESNHYYEVCQAEGLNYERVLKAALASKWVGVPMGRHYRVIKHKGKRGFGGKCFPKDINAWIEYLEGKNIDDSLIRAVRKMNRRILKAQNYNEEEAEQL